MKTRITMLAQESWVCDSTVVQCFCQAWNTAGMMYCRAETSEDTYSHVTYALAGASHRASICFRGIPRRLNICHISVSRS